MVLDFLLFIIEAIPLAMLIGIGAATISFTAWNIVVPLLFVGFGFNVFNTIGASLGVDFVNSFILTILYSRKKKINFQKGLQFGFLAIFAAITGFLFAHQFLVTNQNLLRGGVGYIILALGTFFIFRGSNLRRKTISKYAKNEENQEIVLQSEKKSKEKIPLAVRITIMVIVVIISGTLAGFIGFGSGSIFTLLFLFVFGTNYGFDTLKSTATGCFIMLMLSAVMSVMFASFSANFVSIIPYFGVIAVFSAIGTFIGAKIALKVKEYKLNFIIGSVIIIAAIVSSVQAVLLH